MIKMTFSSPSYWAKNIATLFGLGNKTKFPGTLGSICALCFAFPSYYFLDISAYISILIISTILGFWAINEFLKNTEQKDHSYIIVDEWVGMWVTLLFLFEIDVTFIQTILVAIIGFIVFRVIDISKLIPPIGSIDKEDPQTALSVVLDDVIAGVYSYAILMVVLGFYDFKSIILAFLILLAPMVANMTPVLLRSINKFEHPISEKIFGVNKTWRGLIGGTLAGTLFFYFLFKINFVNETQSIDYILFAGFLLSFGALLGDLVKSYLKRKFQIAPGGSWVPFDQIDYILGAMAMTFFIYEYTISQAILMLILGGATSMLAHRLAYLMKMINTKS